MKRLIPTVVAGFAVVMLMFRGLQLESDSAHAATNSSAALNTSDSVFQALGGATATGFPAGALVAAIALVLALGYIVGSS